MNNLIIVITLLVAGATLGAHAAIAHAATPTPAATATVVATAAPSGTVATPTAAAPVDLRVDVLQDPPRVIWIAAPGAATYQLTGSVLAVKVARSGGCVGDGALRFDLNETLPAGSTSFTLHLSALPEGERWVVGILPLQVMALDAQGRAIGGSGGGLISDACLGPAASPIVGLPGTGAGATSASGQSRYWEIAAIGLMVSAVVAVAGAWGVRERR